MKILAIGTSVLLAIMMVGCDGVIDPEAIPGEYIVGYEDGYSIASIEGLGAKILDSDSLGAINAVVVRSELDLMSLSIEMTGGIRYVEPHYVYRVEPRPRAFEEPPLQRLAQPNDPRISTQYQHRTMESFSAWDQSTGKGVLIAILDTGVDVTHPELQGCVWGRSFIPGQNTDGHGHGTHVAGIAMAAFNNERGGAGTAPEARCIAFKILADNGGGGTAGISQGIIAAADSGAKIANGSFGGGGYSQAMRDAIIYGNSRGMAFFAASGNNNTSRAAYPASYPEAIGVAAVDSSDNRASFSNYGASNTDIACPGVNIFSTAPNGGYATYSGTSMAAPACAGAGALLAAQGLGYQEIAQRLHGTGDVLRGGLLDGVPRVNSLRAVVGSTQPPTAVPTGDPVVSTPFPTKTPQAPPTACQARGLLFGASGPYIGEVLVPCP